MLASLSEFALTKPEVTSNAGLFLLMQHPDVQREIRALAECLNDERKRPQHSRAGRSELAELELTDLNQD